MSIRDDFFAAKAKGSLWDVAVSIKRGNPLPLDADSIFESYAALEAYAADVLAYPGQVVAVVNADSTGIYYLDQDLAIKPVGVIPAGDDLSVEMDDNDVISLHDFGKAFYKYIAEDEENGVAAHYEKVTVSDENLWAAGLEPKVVTEDGKLVLGWFEPNPTTIDGVNDQVTAVQGTVNDLVDSVGTPSTENQEATGLYKEVEDVQEDVEELIDAVGSKDDSLSEDVQTLWAHINDHADRLEDLEAIDHDLYALAQDLADEIDRAEKAEKANADAIKAIADDYLKTEDKYDDTALAARVKAIEDDYLTESDKYDDTAVVGRIETIESDYLKAADIANMATDAEVEAAVAAEATARGEAIAAEVEARNAAIAVETAAREAAIAAEVEARDAAIAVETAAREAAVSAEAKAREDADKALQDQINLIMNNPDTENVINSIEEFTQYIADHGQIAEGFRKDIDDNKTAIANEVKRAGEAEGALSDRIGVLEAIDHEAYIAADTALETKLNAAIDLKANAADLEEAVEDLEKAIDDLNTELSAADTAMDERIAILEGKFTGDGSVEELIAAAKKDAIDTAAADATAKVEAAATAAATDATNKADAAKEAAIAAAATDATNKADAALAAAKEDATAKANAAEAAAKAEAIAQAGAALEAAKADATTKADAALEAAKADATTKADAAKDAAIADAATKYATIDALKTTDNKAEANSDAIEELAKTVEGIVSVGGEANVITKITRNGVELEITDKTVDIDVPTHFSDLTDDSGFSGLIEAAKKQADKGVADAAAADAKADANTALINGHNSRLNVVEALINGTEDSDGLVAEVEALKAHDIEHGAEFNTLSNTVISHGETIADWTVSKANTADLNKAIERIAANEGEIAKKANADSVYTKSEIDAKTGAITEGKTLVDMIAEAQAAATYDDAAVKGLITAEENRAKGEEERLAGLIDANAEAIKANADDIEAINAVLNTIDDEDAITSLKELAIWVEDHGEDAAEMVKNIEANAKAAEANAKAIEAINDEEDGILAQAKDFASGLVNGIPTATAELLGLVKFDDDTIKMNGNDQLYVAKVSTDILVQGVQTLVLNGGSAVE